jgi:hypothetical protein
MKIFKVLEIALLAGMAVLSSCSDDTTLSLNNVSTSEDVINNSCVDFVAQLTPEQKRNFYESGDAFLPEQQKDSWNAVVDGGIPTTWGVFDSPIKQTRAVGIWGSYPAQYWSMIRVKVGNLDENILDALNQAIELIEDKTNVRFYNSQKDAEYYEPYHIKYPNVYVRYAESNMAEGTGNFGLVGGEQYVNVTRELVSTSCNDEERIRFFLHALCNAAGMFNEQQRKDRDDYVAIAMDNVKDNCKSLFDKQTQNYTTQGYFDYNSITLASSTSYSKNGQRTIEKKGGGEIKRNYSLSDLDVYFLNQHYLPYIARTDNYAELDKNVYQNGRLLTETERLNLQKNMNSQRGLYGEPPINGRIERMPW